MRRDIDELADGEFDLLVVGGGMHGAWIALRAVQAGCSVALVEKHDFTAGTSANSLKILHGGLRYLQHLDLPRVRASVASRREFARQTPHLFQPLPCLIPLQMGHVRNPVTMGAALLANEVFSADRNSGVAPRARLRAGSLVSAAECRKALSPLLASTAVAGAVWWDGLATDTARLALDPLLRACEAGAVAANRVEALRYIRVDSRVVGVEARDVLAGRVFRIRARAVVNATGPWVAELSRKEGLPTTALPQAWTAAMNIVVGRSLGIDRAIALSGGRAGDRRRELFIVPWRGVTLIGTHYEPLESVESLGSTAPPAVVQRFMRDIAALAPRAGLCMEDVARVHWGAMPLAASIDRLPARRPFLASGLPSVGVHGLVLLAADKLTSAPSLSHLALRRACAELAGASRFRRAPAVRVPEPLPVPVTVPPDAARRLQSRYGMGWRGVLRHAARQPELLRRIHPASDVLAIEVVHAIREEMALTLDDLMARRLGLADAGAPAAELLQAVARVAQTEWGWEANCPKPASSGSA